MSGELYEAVRCAARKIANEPLEHGMIVNLNGELETHILGDENVVRLTGLPTKDKIVLHNHPESDQSFSVPDIAASAEQDCYIAIVVTSERLYCLFRPSGGWPPVGVAFMDAMLLTQLKCANSSACDRTVCEHCTLGGAAVDWVAEEWETNYKVFHGWQRAQSA